MPRGGARPGAGRPKGRESAATTRKRQVAAKALADGVTPLEVMLEAMRTLYQGGDLIAAAGVAKDAAPYVHPKLSQIEQKSEVTVQKAVSDEPLTPEEWAASYGVGASH